MLETMKKDLFELLNIHAPSYHEKPVSQYLLDKLGGKVDDYILDEHGNLIMNKTFGDGEGATIILSSHMDSVTINLNKSDNREIVEKEINGVNYIFSQLPTIEEDLTLEEEKEEEYPEEPEWWALASKSNRMVKKDFKDWYDYYVHNKPFNYKSSFKPLASHDYGAGGGVAGGDDRCGIAIIIAIFNSLETKTNFNGTLKMVFPTAEEVGCVGSSLIDERLLLDADLAVVIDRRGNSDIVKSCGGYQPFCSDKTVRLFEYCSELQGLDFEGCDGGLSDASTFSELGINSVNLSAGYYDEHTDSERIVFDDMIKTYKLVLQMFGSVNDWINDESDLGEVPVYEQSFGYGHGDNYGYGYGYGSSWDDEVNQYFEEEEEDYNYNQNIPIQNLSNVKYLDEDNKKAYFNQILGRLYFYNPKTAGFSDYLDINEKNVLCYNDTFIYTTLDDNYKVIYNSSSKAQIVMDKNDFEDFSDLLQKRIKLDK